MALALLLDSAGFGEWFMLLAVVLIVVGPKRLPSVARKFGSYYSKFRRAAEGFKRQLLDMETEITRTIDSAEKEVEASLSVEGDGAPADPAPEAPPPATAATKES